MSNLSNTYLPGADQYLTSAMEKQRALKGLSKAELLIERANSEVSIFDVLQDFFGLNLPRVGSSFKSRCPFSYEHSDGGLDKGWRTYPESNSSMCFPMHGYMPPVRLVSIQNSESQYHAAQRILRNYDLLRPKPWRERYDLLLREQERTASIGSLQHAVEALNVALNSIPAYQHRQFDSDVMKAMQVVIGALNEDGVGDNPQRLRQWLTEAKSVMKKVVERTTQ